MQKAIINFRTSAKTKRMAQQKAKRYGVSLSAILNLFLQNFNTEKTDNKTYDIPEGVELGYLAAEEEMLKNGKQFSTVDELMADLMSD